LLDAHICFVHEERTKTKSLCYVMISLLFSYIPLLILSFFLFLLHY